MTNEVAFVDTNLFIRILTNDHPRLAQAALSVFQKAADGELTLVINDLLIAEIIWVLESFYELDASNIRQKVLKFLNTPGLKVEPADLSSRVPALNLYVEKNIDYIDAYIAAWMKAHDISIIYTFNKKHFSRIDGIEVRVPS
ncbi:MAG: PIN domain-containing protein [Anaerolineae bacterium]